MQSLEQCYSECFSSAHLSPVQCVNNNVSCAKLVQFCKLVYKLLIFVNQYWSKTKCTDQKLKRVLSFFWACCFETHTSREFNKKVYYLYKTLISTTRPVFDQLSHIFKSQANGPAITCWHFGHEIVVYTFSHFFMHMTSQVWWSQMQRAFYGQNMCGHFSVQTLVIFSTNVIPFTGLVVQTNMMPDIEIDVCGVDSVLCCSDVTNAIGPDGISPVVHKKCHDIIAPYISIIHKLSLETGLFPQDLKTASVTPVFKSGNKKLRENYRPISLMSIYCKISDTYKGQLR